MLVEVLLGVHALVLGLDNNLKTQKNQVINIRNDVRDKMGVCFL